MNKVLTSIAIGVSCFNISYAQSSVVNQGDKLLYFGYGFPSVFRNFSELSNLAIGGKTNGVGPLHIKYQYSFAENWTIGLNGNADYFINRFDNTGKITNPTLNASVNYLGLSLNARVNKYIIQTNKFALYSGLGFGVRRSFVSFEKAGVRTQEIDLFANRIANIYPIGFEATVGGKLALTPNVLLYAEGGYAKSILQFGIVFKQSKR